MTGPSWTWLVGPWYGGPQHELTGARGRKVTFKLDDAHTASFAIDGREPVAGRIEELVTDLHLLRRQAPGQRAERLFRGRVGPTEDQVGDDGHTVAVSALSYRAVLGRRQLWSDSPLTWTQTDPADIVAGLVADTQGRPGGDLGISVVGDAVGVLRDRTYATGDSIAELITNLGNIDADTGGGFDWDVLSPTADQLVLQIWPGQRGADRGVVLELGGALTAAGRAVDPGDYANALRVTGEAPEAGGDPPTPVEIDADDVATRAEGRWDATISERVSTADSLTDRADQVLADQQAPRPSYTVKLRRGWWRGPGHLWIGDQVRLVLMSRPRLLVDVALRVTELSVGIDDDGAEDVTLTVGPALPDFAERAASTSQRLDSQDRAIARAAARTGGGGGLPGPPGEDGDPGPPGVGVASAVVDGGGHLQITLTNSTVLDTGYVVGPEGPEGPEGPAGSNGTNGTNGVGAVVARSRRTTASSDSSTSDFTLATKITELSATLVSGRLYRISVENLGVFGGLDAVAALQLTYTTNGDSPAPNSTRLCWIQHRTNNAVTTTDVVGHLVAPGNVTLKVLLSIWRGAGAGVVNCWGASDWPIEIVVRDLGTGGVTPAGTHF